MRCRLSIRGLMIATAAVAVALASGVWYLGQTPWAKECRQRALNHGMSEGIWIENTRLSEQGRATILSLGPGRYGLEILDPYPPERPKSPKAAEEFDRRCAETTAICSDRAAYHRRMRQKWLRAATHPWESVPPDPPLPFPIEPDYVRDVSI
jgi:hypothetical protein